jgi:hypothetical protein
MKDHLVYVDVFAIRKQPQLENLSSILSAKLAWREYDSFACHGCEKQIFHLHLTQAHELMQTDSLPR